MRDEMEGRMEAKADRDTESNKRWVLGESAVVKESRREGGGAEAEAEAERDRDRQRAKGVGTGDQAKGTTTSTTSTTSTRSASQGRLARPAQRHNALCNEDGINSLWYVF